MNTEQFSKNYPLNGYWQKFIDTRFFYLSQNGVSLLILFCLDQGGLCPNFLDFLFLIASVVGQLQCNLGFIILRRCCKLKSLLKFAHLVSLQIQSTLMVYNAEAHPLLENDHF